MNQDDNILMVNRSLFEKQFLQCAVCNERYDQAEKSPKLLPCRHTFCLRCLIGIFKQKRAEVDMYGRNTGFSKLACPVCRSKVDVDQNRINALPCDHRAIQMIDFLAQKYNTPINVCPEHYNQPLSFFCKECSYPICRDCTIVSHNKSKGHNIIELSQAMADNAGKINDLEKNTTESLQQMQDRSNALSNALRRLDMVKDEKQREIQDKFTEYQQKLNRRKEELVSQTVQIIENHKAKLKAQQNEVDDNTAELKKLYENFQSSVKINDVRELFETTHQMKGNEAKFQGIATGDDTHLLHSCKFTVKSEDVFLSAMQELGEIKSVSDSTLSQPM